VKPVAVRSVREKITILADEVSLELFYDLFVLYVACVTVFSEKIDKYCVVFAAQQKEYYTSVGRSWI
jgi:hypothetical protein